MAQNKADGTMWDPAIDANPQRDNGATVLMGGNIDTSPTVTNAPDTAITGAGRKKQPGPQANAQTGAQKANSAGNFALIAAGQYVVKGGNITTALAGVAYRGLRGAGNQMQNGGTYGAGLTRKTIVITDWYYSTGGIISSSVNDDDFSTDSVGLGSGTGYAPPTRALPGNVVITDFDGLEPTVVALPAKTG